MGYTVAQTLYIRPSVLLRSCRPYSPTTSVGRGMVYKSMVQKRMEEEVEEEVEHICGGFGYQPKNEIF